MTAPVWALVALVVLIAVEIVLGVAIVGLDRERDDT